MTEEEAKTKICCGPLHDQGSTFQLCMGSRCMAWRELPYLDTRAQELWSRSKGIKVNSAVGDDAEWRPVNPDEAAPPKHGYCALAGKP